jgi:Fe-S-cluster-containing dehydrogenase component
MIFKCPGQDNRNLKSEILNCPNCAYKVELFSDEVKAKCPKCKHLVYKERLPSCIDWCRSSRECIGSSKFQAGQRIDI